MYFYIFFSFFIKLGLFFLLVRIQRNKKVLFSRLGHGRVRYVCTPYFILMARPFFSPAFRPKVFLFLLKSSATSMADSSHTGGLVVGWHMGGAGGGVAIFR